MNDQDTIRSEVIAGLRSRPARLPSKYFYDARGSELFEAITGLDEYYPTRTEISIFKRCGDQIALAVGPDRQIVEYGSGSGLKTRLLLQKLENPRSYVPVEISGEFLLASAEKLREEFPGLTVEPVHADYTRPLELPSDGGSRVVFFPGSTIGNFTVVEAQKFLAQIAEQVGEGGGLLIGVDLKKDPAVLHAAYNDARGITAAFNRNILYHLNRELDADFDPDQFYHYAFYNPVEGRIEMHLVSSRRQTVRLDDEVFEFADGETILTEYSYKYAPEEFDALAARAGLERVNLWADDQRPFGVFYYEVSSSA